MNNIHSSVIIEGDVKLGKDNIILPNCVIYGPTEIGDNNIDNLENLIGDDEAIKDFLAKKWGMDVNDITDAIREGSCVKKLEKAIGYPSKVWTDEEIEKLIEEDKVENIAAE